MKKKFIRILLSLICVTCFLTGSLSAEASQIAETAIRQHYAYMDLAQVDAHTQELVLEARKEIIYQRSWAVDGAEAYVIDENGNLERLPAFSTLFPADWEPPRTEPMDTMDICDLSASKTENTIRPQGVTTNTHVQTHHDQGRIYPVDSGAIAKSFRKIQTTRKWGENGLNYNLIKVKVINSYTLGLPAYATCNMGFTDEASGKSISYLANIPHAGKGIVLTNAQDYTCVGIRASSSNIAGRHSFETIESGTEYRYTNVIPD